MGRLTPITLEDGTTIYIEAIDNPSSPAGVGDPIPSSDDNPKRGGGIVFNPPPQPVPPTFQAIEHTIRAYTTHTLNAFRSGARSESGSSGQAEVTEVTLKFAVNISSEAGIPYIANAKGGCNMEITVKCEFPKKTGQ